MTIEFKILACDETSVHEGHLWSRVEKYKGNVGYHCEGVSHLMEEDIGDEADALLASRLATYGPRVQNMERVAALWSALLGPGREIKDWEVPLLMSAYKMMRTFETPDYSDNSDDIDGWKRMFEEVMEANHGGIIHARTVEEYQAKKDAMQKSEDPIQDPPIIGYGNLEVKHYNFTERNRLDQTEGQSIDEFSRRRQRADDDGVHAVPATSKIQSLCEECKGINGNHISSCPEKPF